MARDYELGMVIRPDVGDDQARAIVERVTQTIGANGGQVVRVNAWGRRRLAYPIEHHRDGLYFFFDAILPPEAIVEMERSIRVNEDIIRHLILMREPRYAAQQRQRDAEADARAAEAQAQAEVRAQTQAAQAEARAQAEAAQAPAQDQAQAEAAQAQPTEAAPVSAAGEAAPSQPDQDTQERAGTQDTAVATTEAESTEA